MKPWTGGQTKPPLGAQINWGHPMAPLECFACVEGAGSTVAGLSGRGLTLMAKGGPAWRDNDLATLTTPDGVEASTPAWLQVQAPATIVWRGVMLAAPTANANMFALTSNNNNASPYSALQLYAPMNAGARRWGLAWSGGTNVLAEADTPAYGQWAMVVGTVQAADQRVYVNGVLKAQTTTAAATMTHQATALTAIGNYTGITRNSQIITEVASIYPRALTAYEVAWLQAEPWCFMSVPGPQVSYFIMPSGAAAAMHYYTQVRV